MAIMNLSAVYKNWEANSYDKNWGDSNDEKIKEKKLDSNFQSVTNSELFL